MNKELKPLTDMELSEIEKYRDENGFINVTGIQGFRSNEIYHRISR